MTFDLRQVDGTNGFFILGTDAGEQLGQALEPAGDINGDRIDDLHIGSAGAVFRLTGTTEDFLREITIEGVDDVVRRSDGFGDSLAPVGDLDGDGLADLVVSLEGTSRIAIVPGTTEITDASVVPVENLTLNAENSIEVEGLEGVDTEDMSVTAVGDVNGDGVTDFAVQLPNADVTVGDEKDGTLQTREDAGEVRIVFGDKFKNSIDLGDLKKNDGFVLVGAEAGDGLGRTVSAAGDVNGDGYGDILVGSETGDGVAYLVLGDKKGPKDPVDLSASSNAVVRLAYEGLAASGAVLAPAGDLDRDGFDDFMIGLPDASIGGKANSGAVLIVSGSAGLAGNALPDTIDLGAFPGTTLLAGAAGDRLGSAVTGAGFVNGDSFLDIAITAEGRDEVAIVFGGGSGIPGTNDLFAEGPERVLNLFGADFDIDFGATLVGGSDFNADGFDDLIIGAPRAPNGAAQNTGQIFGLFGDPLFGLGNENPEPADDVISLVTTSSNSNLLIDNGSGVDIDPDLDGLTAHSLNGAVFNGSGTAVLDGGAVTVTLTEAGQLTARLPISVPLGSTVETTFTYGIEDERGGIGEADVTLTARQSILAIDEFTSANGDVLRGAATGDAYGASVTVIGDMNGDGFKDYAIGSANEQEVAVIFGTEEGIPTNISPALLDGSDGFIFTLSDPSGFDGLRVSAAGDVNGDGLADLAIGAPQPSAPGAAFIVYGADSFDAEMTDEDLAGGGGVVLEGAPGDNSLSLKIDPAGDFNNDGFDDVIVGMPFIEAGFFDVPGRATIIYGSGGEDPLPDTISLAAPGDRGTVITQFGDFESIGVDVSGIGDVNGDDIDDVIIASLPSPLADETAFIIYGSETPDDTIVLEGLDETQGTRITGILDLAARRVSDIGDINNDGLDDFAVSLPGAAGDEFSEGLIYVVFGREGGFGSTLVIDEIAEDEGFFIGGAPGNAFAGAELGPAGDVNGDGIDDLLIGAGVLPEDGPQQGGVYVILGREEAFPVSYDLGELSGVDGYLITGDAPGDFAGFAIAGGADGNGDGIDDILIGAPGSDFAGADRGAVHVVYGQPSQQLAPVANDDEVTSLPDVEFFEFDLFANDVEINVGDSFSILESDGSGLSAPFIVEEDGTFFYAPVQAFQDLPFGSVVVEEFHYTIVDETGLTDSATLEITIERDAFLDPIFPAEALPGQNLLGNDEKNKLSGTEFGDLFSAEGGQDKLKGKRGDDYLYGGDGPDKLYGDKGNDVMFGGTGNDLLDDKEGNNFYFANEGDDRIRAGRLDDIIVGGDGNDIISDIDGADDFIFEPGWGDDEIKGFQAESDRLIFTDPDLTSWDQLEIGPAEQSKNTLIQYGNDSILLRKVDFTELTEDNFKFELTLAEVSPVL